MKSGKYTLINYVTLYDRRGNELWTKKMEELTPEEKDYFFRQISIQMGEAILHQQGLEGVVTVCD